MPNEQDFPKKTTYRLIQKTNSQIIGRGATRSNQRILTPLKYNALVLCRMAHFGKTYSVGLILQLHFYVFLQPHEQTVQLFHIYIIFFIFLLLIFYLI